MERKKYSQKEMKELFLNWVRDEKNYNNIYQVSYEECIITRFLQDLYKTTHRFRLEGWDIVENLNEGLERGWLNVQKVFTIGKRLQKLFLSISPDLVEDYPHSELLKKVFNRKEQK